MGVLKDFECKCGIREEYIEPTVNRLWCRDCKRYATHVFVKAPSVVGCDSYNPHYDIQMGQYFESKEQKDSWLKKTGREQISGSSSPRRSTKDRMICSKSQARSL